MERSKVRRIVLPIVVPYFDKLGFRLQTTLDLGDDFIKETETGLIRTGFYFTNSIHQVYDKVSIVLLEIENLIKKIGVPNSNVSEELMDLTSYPSTIYDSSTILGYEAAITKNANLVKNESDAKSFANTVIAYMQNEGTAFIDKYSFLPNVLEEMDQLQSEGKLWKRILGSTGPEYFWRGLIISKLCNDVKFAEKVKYVDSIYYDKQYELEEWVPYYEKLKERLKSIEPKHNV